MNHDLPAVYDATVFVVDPPPGPAPARFAVITAWNPTHRVVPVQRNHRADRRLDRELARRRLPHWRATGCSPDRDHCEPGWAVAVDFAGALALARQFDQLALWWIENGQLELIDCRDGSRRPLGRFHDRILETHPPRHPQSTESP